MVYNATGDLTGITHVTTGTVATLNPVGNGVSQVTSITQGASPAVNSSVATVRALGLVGPMGAAAAAEMEMPYWGTPIKAGEFIKMCSWVWRPSPAVLLLMYPVKTSQCSDLPPKNPDECDDCLKKWGEEGGRCGQWHRFGPKDDPFRWVRACKDRALDRLRLCYANGGSTPSDAPGEWGEQDMDVFP